MAKAQKRHWLSRLSFGTVSLIASALMVLGYLSVVIDPAKAWFFTLFGLVYPVVLPLGLPGPSPNGKRRSRWFPTTWDSLPMAPRGWAVWNWPIP